MDEPRTAEDADVGMAGSVPTTSSARPQPRRRRSKSGKRWGAIAVVAIVLVASGFFVYSALGRNKSTTQYVTQQISTGTLTVVVTDGTGTTESNSSTAVDPGVSGTVTELDVRLGSQVKDGQVLFVIDNPDLDASVQQSKAQYQQAQSSVTKAVATARPGADRPRSRRACSRPSHSTCRPSRRPRRPPSRRSLRSPSSTR